MSKKFELFYFFLFFFFTQLDEFELFARIDPRRELYRKLWEKHPDQAPNVKALTDRINSVSVSAFFVCFNYSCCDQVLILLCFVGRDSGGRPRV